MVAETLPEEVVESRKRSKDRRVNIRRWLGWCNEILQLEPLQRLRVILDRYKADGVDIKTLRVLMGWVPRKELEDQLHALEQQDEAWVLYFEKRPEDATARRAQGKCARTAAFKQRVWIAPRWVDLHHVPEGLRQRAKLSRAA